MKVEHSRIGIVKGYILLYFGLVFINVANNSSGKIATTPTKTGIKRKYEFNHLFKFEKKNVYLFLFLLVFMMRSFPLVRIN